uniref:Chemokine (C-C motif) receptor 6a n=1 Tax=Myripristis murdjan TaxID=586833 RepID=A0A667ZQ14_9TELE
MKSMSMTNLGVKCRTDGQEAMENLTDSFDNSTYDDYGYDEYELKEPCEMSNNHRLELVVGPYIHSIICILGFIGNSLVIITYAFYKRAKSMTDVYLLNVAIADLLFVLALPLIIYNEEYSWVMGTAACKLLHGVYSMNLYSGMLLLACISTDRYIAIVQARRSFRLRSLLYSRVICFFVWVFALGVSIPTFVYYEVFTSNNTAWRVKILVPSTQIAVGFFLPLLIMVFCYTSVIITLMRAKNFQRHKAVRVVLAVVAVFIACHLPYNITLLYEAVNMFNQQECGMVDIQQVAKTVTKTIAYLHCCLNPVLYAFIGVKFRNHFRKIVQDLWVTSEIYVSTRRSVDGSSDNGSSFTM